MKPDRTPPQNVDEYIAEFIPPIGEVLERIRQTIRKAAPDAEERISYGMPCFKLHENLVYFAAMKNHIGFYPTSSGVAEFKKELAQFECSKGAIRFPLDRPIPYSLIAKITRFRVQEVKARVAAKAKTKSKSK